MSLNPHRLTVAIATTGRRRRAAAHAAAGLTAAALAPAASRPAQRRTAASPGLAVLLPARHALTMRARLCGPGPHPVAEHGRQAA